MAFILSNGMMVDAHMFINLTFKIFGLSIILHVLDNEITLKLWEFPCRLPPIKAV